MLGDVLKKRREELGLEVQDIARVTGKLVLEHTFHQKTFYFWFYRYYF